MGNKKMDINKFKNLNVLYIEDEIELRDVTCASLSSIIPNISVANNGKEGFRSPVYSVLNV